jgi:two-component system, chemotaxis family, chemotaxis protein CheY
MDCDVLVVDDYSAIRKILQRILRQTGLGIGNIYGADDGLQALELLKIHKVDVILTDVIMPNMDGMELLAAVKSAPQWRHIPILLVTTEGSESKVSEALRLGASGYVRKPFTADQIKEKLAGILAAKRQA